MQEAIIVPADGIPLAGVLHLPDSHRFGERMPAFLVLHGFIGSKESHAEIQAKMFEA